MKYSLLLAVPCLAAPFVATAQENPDAAKLEKLSQSAQSYVDAYNKADAEGISNLFLKNGEIILATGEVVSGRENIKVLYEEAFDAGNDSQGALEAGAVRFILPGIAVEQGTFHVTLSSGEVTSHNYTAVQVEQEDGSWLTASIKDSLEDTALPAEKLIALDWMIGDWEVQIEGTTVWLAFDWSDDGPFIDGRILIERSGSESSTSTYRIGWNPVRKGFTSWGFDDGGGFTKSDWTFDGDDGWVIRAQGITSDGEINVCTQEINVAEGAQSFEWKTRDQTIGGDPVASRSFSVVKRPPTPKSAASK